jgi:dienelactone hydrolase
MTLNGCANRLVSPFGISEQMDETFDVGRPPVFQYGRLEPVIRKLRSYRPLDLSAPNWKAAHPSRAYEEWRALARRRLLEGLHYDPGPVDLKPTVLERVEEGAIIRERIEFNTTAWFRVPGYFCYPRTVSKPIPGLLVLHEWGGPMVFGADRVCGPARHELIVEHRNITSSGRALAEWFAEQGYAVITIDAYHFGNRVQKGIRDLPPDFDPYQCDRATLDQYQKTLTDLLYLGVRHLNWAGTTWAGVNFYDDSRCVDYLLTRPEVDHRYIGATGLSGGGWRTNMLAALEDRITATVTVGWMTTGDTQQAYNVEGGVGTFCLLPGVWNRMDIPDMIAMAAPKACMVVSGTRDHLNPPKGQRDAAKLIADAYAWAACPERFNDHAPDKPHCYDEDVQEAALAWFDRHLRK